MDQKQEFYLSTALYVSLADGNISDQEISAICNSNLFKPFISTENIRICGDKIKKITAENLDVVTFLKSELKKVKLNKEDTRNLIEELLKIACSDQDFSQNEQYILKLLCQEFEIDEMFFNSLKDKYLNESTSENTLGQNITDPISYNLKLNKNELNFLFNSKEDKLSIIILNKINNNIKEKISVSDFKITIDDIQIKKVKRVAAEVLIDERTIHKSSEINYTGIRENRSLNESQIGLWEDIRTDYEYINLSKKKIFRVDGTNQTYACSQCNGSKKNTCYVCSGSGKNRCNSCSGRGEKRCSSCGGTSEKKCWSCSGSGQKSSYTNGEQVYTQCSSCAGRGRNPCNSCGNGYVTCSNCSGQGQVTCHTCSGLGELPCSKCDAQGYFTSFFNIHSTLISNKDYEYLNGIPDKNYLIRTLIEEKFDFKYNFGEFSIKSLSEYSSDCKNIYIQKSFKINQLPKIIIFKLEECVSMTFSIKIGESVYLGGLDNNGALYYDKSILSQLFFKVIDEIKVTENFKSLTKIRESVINQIPQIENAFHMITEFNSLKGIIESNDKIELKLNKTRKIKLINKKAYLDFLVKKLKLKVMSVIIPLNIISHLGLFLFSISKSYDPLFWTLITLSINLLITRYLSYQDIENNSEDNDASNTVIAALITSLVVITISIVIVYFFGYSVNIF